MMRAPTTLSTRGAVCTAGLAVVFAFVVAAKLEAPDPWLRHVEGFVSSGTLAAASGWLVVIAEGVVVLVALVGLSFRSSASARAACGVALALASLWTVAAAASGPRQDCGCFGRAVEATRGRRLLVAGIVGFLSLGALSAERTSKERSREAGEGGSSAPERPPVPLRET